MSPRGSEQAAGIVYGAAAARYHHGPGRHPTRGGDQVIAAVAGLDGEDFGAGTYGQPVSGTVQQGHRRARGPRQTSARWPGSGQLPPGRALAAQPRPADLRRHHRDHQRDPVPPFLTRRRTGCQDRPPAACPVASAPWWSLERMPCSATLIRRPTKTAEGGDSLVGVEGAAANTFIGAMPRSLAGSTLRIKNQARTVTMASTRCRLWRSRLGYLLGGTAALVWELTRSRADDLDHDILTRHPARGPACGRTQHRHP